MLSTKAVGREAATRKYDILTALATYALARGKHDHRLVLRLMALITARYNWSRNELAVGQREIARMWSVDERTVKREMAKLRAFGWLEVKRQGVRGRVTEYGMNFDKILDATRDDWSKVGPDFDIRMQGPVAQGQVVALPVRGHVPAPVITEGSDWSLVQALLHSEDPATYGSWFHALRSVNREGERLTLQAPSRFHAAYVQSHLSNRLHAAFHTIGTGISEVVIID